MKAFLSLRPSSLALLFLCFLLAVLLNSSAAQCEHREPWQANHVTVNGLSVTFQDEHTIGVYATGDIWVLGPVIVTATNPPFNGTRHGHEINPGHRAKNGFDSRLTGFDATLAPIPPFTIANMSSFIKAQSVNTSTCRPCLDKVMIITVVTAIPPDNGRYTLRPNYPGAIKYNYLTSNLHTSFLPNLDPSGLTLPSVSSLVTSYSPERLRLDHIQDWTGRDFHPTYSMPDYGADVANQYTTALLRFLFNDTSTPQMTCLLHRYLQVGLDTLAAMRQLNLCFPPNGGHNLGRKLPAIFAALVVQDSEALTFLRSKISASCFHEDAMVFNSSLTRVPLFGNSGTERQYWQNHRDDSGSRTVRDPYGYIDGGHVPGSSYQYCCNSLAWKAMATGLALTPALRREWQNEQFMDYVARWTTFGAWAAPDHCAPVMGTCRGGDHDGEPCTRAQNRCTCRPPPFESDPNYGVTYGPDGRGGCIKDTDPSDGYGRMPHMHGRNKGTRLFLLTPDSGEYANNFGNQLHAKYFNDTHPVNGRVPNLPTTSSTNSPPPQSLTSEAVALGGSLGTLLSTFLPD